MSIHLRSGGSRDVQIKITDLGGRTLIQKTLSAAQGVVWLDMGDIPNGLYFCTVKDHLGNQWVDKLVIGR